MIFRLWESEKEHNGCKTSKTSLKPEERLPAIMSANIASHDGTEKGAEKVSGAVALISTS